MRVLVLSPHTDDAELGAGGTIARLAEENEVWVVAFSTADDDRLKGEFREAATALKVQYPVVYRFPRRDFTIHRQAILDHIIGLREEIGPDLVLTPSLKDVHQDHRVVALETRRAFRDVDVWGYELLWNTPDFQPQQFVKLQTWHLEAKMLALSQYKSQINRFYFDEDLTLAWARVRGAQVGSLFAEAFEVMKGVL